MLKIRIKMILVDILRGENRTGNIASNSNQWTMTALYNHTLIFYYRCLCLT